MDPYISITDFTDFSQVDEMLKVFNAHCSPTSRRRLAVGVMMSYKTLNDIPTRWASAFPPKETIAGIFGSDETINCLHYADYDAVSTARDLSFAIECGGIGIDALQLDMVWPAPEVVANAVHMSRRHLDVILQIGKLALEDVNENPCQLVARLENYVVNGVIQRVLLDKSMGRGLGMDAQALLPFARAIRRTYQNLGLGAAGGLGPDTIGLIKPLSGEFPELSIDAQGKLRPSGNALDPIDWSMAANYLSRALELLC